LASFVSFAQRIAYYGVFNSLSQALIKMTAPGVPDFYQGSELWDLSFVDPDNRQLVDFAERVELLAAVKKAESEDLPAFLREALVGWHDGRVKLFLTYKSLNFRNTHRALFLDGDYMPLQVSKSSRRHVVSFCRSYGGASAVTVVPRGISQLVHDGKPPLTEEAWGTDLLFLPEAMAGGWRNALTGEELVTSKLGEKSSLALGDIFRLFPVALLYREA
jgi:(1->4)-alpha-D-glucan 1-alpha-D-glucosylmutase